MGWETGNETQRQLYGDAAVRTQDSTRAFMNRVYLWMVAGLGLTGGVAFVVASTPSVLSVVMGLWTPLIIAELVMVVAFSFLVNRVPGIVAAAMFLGYALLNGLTFAAIFLRYPLGSISSAFFVTAGAFGALSLFAIVTKKDLSGWSTFLFMGLFGIIIAGVVNLFLRSPMMDFVISAAGVLVFAGLTAWDTQKLRSFAASVGPGGEGNMAVAGALTLYLDFVNLFLSLLRLFGDKRR